MSKNVNKYLKLIKATTASVIKAQQRWGQRNKYLYMKERVSEIDVYIELITYVTVQDK